MAFSISSNKNADAVLLGLGILGLATFPASSAGQFDDVGYLKGMNVTYTRELKDFESGGTLVKRLVFRDRLSFSADYAEVSIDNMEKVFQGDRSGEVLTFGGGRTVNRFAARFEHVTDTGDILRFDMFKAAPGGEFSLAFAEEDFITYPVQFDAELDDTQDVGEQYGRISLIAA